MPSVIDYLDQVGAKLNPIMEQVKQITNLVDVSKGMTIVPELKISVQNPTVNVPTQMVVQKIAPYVIVALALFFILYLTVFKK